jgi:CBS domain-containing protein
MDFLVKIFLSLFNFIYFIIQKGIPVTEGGKINGKLLGLITFRDIDFISKDQWTTPVSQLMTPIEELVTALNDLTLKDAYHILQRSKKGSYMAGVLSKLTFF